MNGYREALSKYAQFSGRSRRSEYWGFVLVNIVISVIASLLLTTVGMEGDGYNTIGWVVAAVMVLYGLFILLPNLALGWRRYQDIGWHGAVSIVGWFIPVLTFIVALIPGNLGTNQYGPDPR